MLNQTNEHRRIVAARRFINLDERFLIIAFLIAVVVLFLLPPDARAQGAPDIVWSNSYSATTYSVAYAPDRQTVLSGHANVFSNLWQATDGTLLRSSNYGARSRGCGGTNSVTYSPDGQTGASATGCDVRLWRVADGSLIRVLGSTMGANSFQAPTFVVFSPDSQYVATAVSIGYHAGSITLWRASDGTQLRVLNGGSGNVVAF